MEESTQEALLNKWRKIARKQDIKAGVAIILLAIIGIGRVIGLGYLSSPLLRLYGQFIFFGVLTLAFSVLRIWYNKKRGLLEEAFPEEFSAFQKKKVEVDKAKAARSAARKAARRASAVEKVLKDYGIEIA